MRYEFTSVYSLTGIAPNPILAKKEPLLKHVSSDCMLYLVSQPDVYLSATDLNVAVTNTMLDRMFGSRQMPFEEQVKQQREKIVSDRREKYGHFVFIVILFRGTNAEVKESAKASEFSDFLIDVDAPRYTNPRANHASEIDQILAKTILTFEGLKGIVPIASGTTYFCEDSDKIYVPFNVTFSGSASVASLIKSEEIDELAAKLSIKHGNAIEIATSASLLVSSFQVGDDSLRAYLWAWYGLEIFVNKLFRQYENLMLIGLASENHGKAAANYVERIQEVMKDKFRLTDKFWVIAGILAPATASEDSLVFGKIKKIRDQLSHGEHLPNQLYDAEKPRQLLRRYLVAHLAYGS